MDKDFERMIKMNVQGRVFVTCQSRGVTDPTIIGYYVEIMEQSISALLNDESKPSDFQRIMEEQLVWLEGELDQVRQDPSPAVDPEPEADAQEQALHKEDKLPTGYVPEAKSMPERLKDRRAVLEELLDNDCVTLKLVTPEGAKVYKHGLLGKEPTKAEEEVVTALRNVLHDQIRKFIRANNGGPWATAVQQHEVRMDITKTRTLRSLVSLARELLQERDEWLQKTKNSLTGRLFGGRVNLDK